MDQGRRGVGAVGVGKPPQRTRDRCEVGRRQVFGRDCAQKFVFERGDAVRNVVLETGYTVIGDGYVTQIKLVLFDLMQRDARSGWAADVELMPRVGLGHVGMLHGYACLLTA